MSTLLKTAFATYPSVKLKNIEVDKKTGKTVISTKKELLFGDYIQPFLNENGTDYERLVVVEKMKEVEYIKVYCRGAVGYILESEMQPNRILEVNFIDVGQGDGCHIVTPDDKHFLIDAGDSDNMYRFLKWRFNLNKDKPKSPPFTVVISHSDSDHYQGFGQLFKDRDNAKFIIKKIYHNGMVEESGLGPGMLGTIIEHDGCKYVTDLCDTNADYEKRIQSVKKRGLYINTLEKSSAPKQSLRLGSAPIYDNCGMKMEIFGPVAQDIDGKAALPVFDGDKGKTKNGHSVIIKLTYGHLRLLLGGDLNTDSEYYLIKHFSGIDVANIKAQLKDDTISSDKRKELEAQLKMAIDKTREVLEVDIAKSCHHGSADFTSEFLKVLNPIATVISSGDNEPHTHPRPDTLGTIGKHSRGERSLIFSTELARSGKEFVDIKKLNTQKSRERVVTVYGMINVRTDGEKVIVAQKLEKPAKDRNWDIHKLEWNEEKGVFEYNQYLKYEYGAS